MDMVEGVQRQATKQLPSLKELSYTQRHSKLKLPTLSYRRVRGDMIEVHVYKIVTENMIQKIGQLLKMGNDQTTRPTLRGNAQKLYTQRARLM